MSVRETGGKGTDMGNEAKRAIDAVRRHLDFLLDRQDGKTVGLAIQQDGEDRVGNPVVRLEINSLVELYPTRTDNPVQGILERIGYLETNRQWAVDVLVDASDPSVGIFGHEPLEHSLHSTLGDALLEVGRLLTAERIESSLEAEGEEQRARELEEEYKRGWEA